MADKIKIRTPEHVELEFELAGLGSRLMAVLIDALIQYAILFGLEILNFILQLGVALDLSALSSLSLAFLILLIFAIIWGYYVFFEMIWNGQTPGKRKMKLRVIRDTGHPIDFQSSVVRNILRIADYIFAAGFFVLFFSPHSKRLGDYAAGTLVVKLREEEAISIFTTNRSLASTPPPQYQLLDDQSLSHIERLSRQDYETIRRYLDRSGYLDSDRAGELARQIAEPLMERLGVPRPQISFHYAYSRLLSEIAQAYERHKGS